MENKTLELAKELIRRPSVTPDDTLADSSGSGGATCLAGYPPS